MAIRNTGSTTTCIVVDVEGDDWITDAGDVVENAAGTAFDFGDFDGSYTVNCTVGGQSLPNSGPVGIATNTFRPDDVAIFIGTTGIVRETWAL